MAAHKVVGVPADDRLNAFGFSEASYDEQALCVLPPPSIRKQMTAAIPSDYQTNWKYYGDAILSLFGYTAVGSVAIYFQRRLSIEYYAGKQVDIWPRLKYLCLAPIVGWSYVGFALCAHDSNHGTFAPKKTLLGNLLNKVVSFVCMDCALYSSAVWNRKHNLHHKNVNIPGVDDMNIRGNNLITEQLYALSNTLKYTLMDFRDLFLDWKVAAHGGILNLFGAKTRIVCGSFIRFYYVFYVLHNHGDVCMLSANLLWATVVINYIGFLSHSLPVRSKGKSDDYFVWAMRETWDIFPRSSWMNFLHCGVGAHCSHHIFPYLPRSMYAQTAPLLTKLCKDEYREIDSVKAELWLLWNRREVM